MDRSNKRIDFVRLFPYYSSSSYFISDQNGTQWAGLDKHVSTELKSRKNVQDVAIAGDGSWCVIHQSGATSSNGILSKIYSGNFLIFKM